MSDEELRAILQKVRVNSVRGIFEVQTLHTSVPLEQARMRLRMVGATDADLAFIRVAPPATP